ncbi:hypothetical protein DICA0_C06414 [Diutina catenulata]
MAEVDNRRQRRPRRQRSRMALNQRDAAPGAPREPALAPAPPAAPPSAAAPARFESDLDYLLGTSHECSVPAPSAPEVPPAARRVRKTKSLRFSPSEIAQDIDDIDLDAESPPPTQRASPKKRGGRRKKSMEVMAAFAANDLSKDDSLADMSFISDDEHSTSMEVSFHDDAGEATGQATNGQAVNGAPTNGTASSHTSHTSDPGASSAGAPSADASAPNADTGSAPGAGDSSSSSGANPTEGANPDQGSHSAGANPTSGPNTDQGANQGTTPGTNPTQESRLSKKKSRSQLRKKRSRAKLREAKEAAAAAAAEEEPKGLGLTSVSAEALPPTPSIAELARKPSVAALIAGIERGEQESPFAVQLRPLNINNTKKSEKLPEVQPLKSIIGLSSLHILKLNSNDVKMKTLKQSSTLSKYAATGLSFTNTHSDELFANPDKQRVFFLLCINVALFEAVGFKKTLQAHPDILELFGGYPEINLETTRTKLTPSNKQVHQNNLDYSVLSYLGNILIWAANMQREAGKPLLYQHYDLGFDCQVVRDNVGGWHLWDRLHRERKHMSSKRWKHVIKFRTAFPFEVDQFVLMLRYMKADVSNLLE